MTGPTDSRAGVRTGGSGRGRLVAAVLPLVLVGLLCAVTGKPGGLVSETVLVRVTRPWRLMGHQTDWAEYQYFTLGIDRKALSEVPVRPVAPDPKCSLARLWQEALRRGAPTAAVATIAYNAEGYSFRIADTPVDLTFDRDCRPR